MTFLLFPDSNRFDGGFMPVSQLSKSLLEFTLKTSWPPLHSKRRLSPDSMVISSYWPPCDCVRQLIRETLESDAAR